ncbi:MAG: hypothetical protein K9L73_04690, partial [Spirochaetia bacterium]|nr:hypothetical protein [Spirochaetia bacterium]
MRNTTISAHTTAAQTRERYGMLIIFLVLIISQFVSIELFTVHTMVISFEKLSAIVLYPIAIVLIGIRAIRVRKELILFSVLLYITFSISSAVSSGLSTAVLTNAIIIGMNAMVALLMYSVLLIDNKAIRTFFIIWIVCSVITSIICIGQFYEVLPLLDEPSLFRGQPRAEGLLKDPNYQALVLLFGLGALITLRSIRFRLLYIIIIVVGIASTMSRMGILGSLLLMLISPF